MNSDAASVRVVQVVTVSQSLGFINGLICYLKQRGYAFWAISSPGPDVEHFSAETEVLTFEISMPRAITPLRDLWTVGAIWWRLRQVRPHIVHAGTPKGGLLGMVAASLAGVPVRIYQMRGLPMLTASGLRRKVLRVCEKASCSLAHKVICNSESLRKAALAEGICTAEKATVIGSGSGQGVDARQRFNPDHVIDARGRVRSEWGLPHDALALAFIGRIVREKGIVELTGSWRELREEFPTLHLMVAGDFEPQDPVPPECVELLRTDPRVHLMGFVTDIRSLYAALDLLVLPTYREGFPNVLLEAGAMVLPVVATIIPGCVDATVDGVTGHLVPPRDTAALTAALRAYLSDPALRRAHGLSGRQRVLDHFQQEIVWEGVRSLYAEMLTARGLPAPP